MKFKLLFLLLSIGFVRLCATAGDTANSIDPVRAKQYFEEIKKISETDAGHLWGVRLYGPTLLVNPDNRSVIANQPDTVGRLKPRDGIYAGQLDADLNISNTAVPWSGRLWTMVENNAILRDDPYDRARLLLHESWHRIQNDIGIAPVLSANIHLDENDGRLSLLLEFRALSRALRTKDTAEQKEALSDALIFRSYRQTRFPNNNENAFERHEGLAEYTGLKLCGLPDSLLFRIVARKLQLGESNNGLANSFAYLTGPALGLLLDRYDPAWRKKACDGADLPSLLAAAIAWHAPDRQDQLQSAFDRAGSRYDFAALKAANLALENDREIMVDSFRKRLVARGKLIVPNNNINFSFNPEERLIPFDSLGVIYRTMRLSGDFGVLTVTDGILRTNDWRYFIVVAPEYIAGDTVAWEGYKLELKAGWQIIPKGDGISIVGKQ